VGSLAHPGGNITGSTLLGQQLGSKRLEILRDAIAGLLRVAVLGDMHVSSTVAQFNEIDAAAVVLGLHVLTFDVGGLHNLDAALEAVIRERADALILPLDPRVHLYGERVLQFAIHNRLPTMSYVRPLVEAGSLMGYGPSHEQLHRRAAYFVDRILKGAKPADQPVEQPMTFDFVVNKKTARELGITFPPEIMLQVTEMLDG
jgi:putative ABC transport system substrate-binding protein